MSEHSMKGCTCRRCESKREMTRRWAQSERGQAYHRAYKRQDAYRLQQAEREKTARGREIRKAAKAKFNASPKGVEARKREDARRRASEAHRDKLAARKAVHKAKKSGKLAVPEACRCGAPGPLEAHHHHGYAREHRLDVVFLCAACHRAEEA